MGRRATHFGILAGLFLGLFVTGSASATCWSCAWGEGLGWYCYSVAGDGAAECTPDWSEPCVLIGSANCATDGCQCYRYPPIPRVSGVADLRPKATLTECVLLLRGRDENSNQALLESLQASPEALRLDAAQFGPDIAISKLAAYSRAVSPDEIQIAAYGAASRTGLAVARLVGADGVGILIDARRGVRDPHLQISQVLSSGLGHPSGNLDVSRDEMVIARVRVGDTNYACVVWAEQISGSAEDGDQSNRLRAEFIDASEHHPALHLDAIRADVPTLEAFKALERLSGPSSPWPLAVSFYR